MVVLDAESHAFPKALLAECSSVVLLFCSGRMGAADGFWVREAGLVDVTAVDWDEKTLEPFRARYPEEWSYARADVFEWVKEQERRWDLVSADAPSQWDSRFAETLPAYCSLAERFVVATVLETTVIPEPPAGWSVLGRITRCGYEGRLYQWLVLQRLAAA